MIRWSTLILLVAIALAGCTPARLDGANLLQSRTVSFEDRETADALRQLRALGASTVAVVVFLEQDHPAATRMSRSDAVTDAQLVAAIRSARRHKLNVFIKPQFLVPDSWAGAIDPHTEADWETWFETYQDHLLHYAHLARQAGAQGFVIGTELARAAQRPEWANAIAALREHFPGTLSYAAHGVEELEAFAHWSLLDLAGVTLYPSLGEQPTRAAMEPHIKATVQQLQSAAAQIDTPLWIAEVGIQSRAAAQRNPWEWQDVDEAAAPDPELQATVIDLWLDALAGDWHQGVLLWAWSNDPRAGGPADRDYLLQNKPAERVMHCHWTPPC